jgi:hypothetical protein
MEAAIVYDEAVSGDLSDAGLSPTSVTMALGSNQVLGTTDRLTDIDRDYLWITVPDGLVLSSIVVMPRTMPSGVSFIGVQAGTQVTVLPDPPDATGLLGWTHYSPADVGTDVLDNMSLPSFGSTGFVPPLGAGNYAFWIQEFDVIPYGFDFTLSRALTIIPEPETYMSTLLGLAILLVIVRHRRSGKYSGAPE